ncbi:MAG: response regulator with CheY-like receiver domain and winged-helix DNA-binding domain [Verrucomicrobiales bacterium]|nr:response regulator with CheY-like receiver domain and winged-helix DNA-binding domain [Verrucomicrobiales bacterium]
MDSKRIVLLAEDEENDVYMMQRAVSKMDFPVSLHVAKDGAVAIQYLSGEGKYADRALYPLPTLILLDIKMPRKNGFDVLEWLKSDGSFTNVPVVMISSSNVRSDLAKACALGASAYLVKPVSPADLNALLTATEQFLSFNSITVAV